MNTNEEQLELIAEARELCERKKYYAISKIGELKERLNYAPPEHWQIIAYEIGEWENEERGWTTHLTEMKEHEGLHTNYGYVCQECSKSFSLNGVRQYPCDFLLTKVKRLLGGSDV